MKPHAVIESKGYSECHVSEGLFVFIPLPLNNFMLGIMKAAEISKGVKIINMSNLVFPLKASQLKVVCYEHSSDLSFTF